MIPKTFELGGTEWTISIEESATNGENLGRCSIPECKITIQKLHGGNQVSESQMEATFYHELIHAFFDSNSYHELSGNEQLVSHLGNCLHQYMKTKK